MSNKYGKAWENTHYFQDRIPRKTEVKGIKMGYTRPIFSKSQVNMANFIFAFNY